MPLDPNAFAEMVALTIKAALTPVLERVAGLEAQVKQALAVEPSVTALRDRVVAVEVKAAVLPTPTEPADVDLTPVLERVAGLETTIDVLKDRVLVTETKAALPVVATGPTVAEIELLIHGQLEPITKALAAVQERVAVVETRAPIPGPSGEKGADGANGTNGKDGHDGLGFDDLNVEFDGDRTIALKFHRGDVTKTWPLVLPFQKYQGIYQQGKSYDAGDTVTWGNQMWHCHESTVTPPGDGSKFWTLCVRKGRDGKDGRDAPTMPVVKVGSGS